MMVIDNKFQIGDIVYLITDNEQNRRIVTTIQIKPCGSLVYEISYGSIISYHYEFELADEENILTKTGVSESN